ncbi:MAG: hypothetical protein RLY82_187 [Pseudomonadota bacterium]
MSMTDSTNPPPTVLVWDRIVRLGHWLLATSFIVAYLSAESERWRLVHVISGCLVFAAVTLRVLWGMVGTRHARFANFVRNPKHAITYLKSLVSRHPEHHIGHNPAGGWAVLSLLSLSAVVSITGWMAYNNLGGARQGQWHELTSNLALLLVLVHVAAVVISSYFHKENLLTAMFTGRRNGSLSERIKEVSYFSVLSYFSILFLIAFYAYQWA